MADQFSLATIGSRDKNLYCMLLDNALQRAISRDSRISAHALSIFGMSGGLYRRFINNLVASIPSARYLEIGSWMGSTACAAMDGNKLRIVCIDNWSEFDGPKDKFIENTSAFVTDNVAFQLIESDFRNVDYTTIGTFNIYLFDGPHERQDQFDGAALPLPALDKQFVFIVDDWNFERVRVGTMDALKAFKLEIEYAIEIRTTQDDSHAAVAWVDSDWHNGYFIAVLRQT